MKFPYQSVTSWLAVGCDAKSEWAYFGFDTAPNLVKTATQDGYDVLNRRIKWDGTLAQEELIQKWGEPFLHFSNDTRRHQKILTSKSVLLELDWYGEQNAYFQYPMDGAADAVASMRAKCAQKRPQDLVARGRCHRVTGTR